jgi:hypothetical protein
VNRTKYNTTPDLKAKKYGNPPLFLPILYILTAQESIAL